MVRKPASLKLSRACEGFIRYKFATGKSPNTPTDYRPRSRDFRSSSLQTRR